MDQILHIFKKDIRRHWPEILISLALLALFTDRALHPWRNWVGPYRSFHSFYFFIVTGEYVGAALVLSWLFLVIRIVQGEPLVGDRQWWITKPYVWWQLLLAKLLLIVVFVCIPLFHVQLFLLHHFQFPVLRNVSPLLLIQLSILLLLICFCVLLAGLTKNLAQLLLVVGAAALVLIGAAIWSSQNQTSSAIEATPIFVDRFTDFLIWGSLLGAVAWQFARRRRWMVIAALVLALGFAAAINAAFTSSKAAEQRYTPIDLSAAPIRISIKPIQPSNDDKDYSRPSSGEVPVTIPVTVSGVAAGTMIQLNAVKIYAEPLEASRWSRGWLPDYQQFWPEDQQRTLSYAVDRKEYQKFKDTPLHLRVDLALSEYQVVDSRPLIVSRQFSSPSLGTCRIAPFNDSQLHCLYPLRNPDYVLRFDPQESGCPDEEDEQRTQAETVSYAWHSGEMGFPDLELDAISAYDPYFDAVSVPPPGKEIAKFRTVRLCPSTVLTLSRPILKRHIRIQLEPFTARLADLANAPLRFNLAR